MSVDNDILKNDKGLQENSKLKVWITKAKAYQCIEFGLLTDLHKKGRKVGVQTNPRRSPRTISTEKGRKRTNEKLDVDFEDWKNLSEE